MDFTVYLMQNTKTANQGCGKNNLTLHSEGMVLDFGFGFWRVLITHTLQIWRVRILSNIPWKSVKVFRWYGFSRLLLPSKLILKTSFRHSANDRRNLFHDNELPLPTWFWLQEWRSSQPIRKDWMKHWLGGKNQLW